jgi:hypothetical protein
MATCAIQAKPVQNKQYSYTITGRTCARQYMMFVHDVTHVRLAKKTHGSLGNYPKRKQKANLGTYCASISLDHILFAENNILRTH